MLMRTPVLILTLCWAFCVPAAAQTALDQQAGTVARKCAQLTRGTAGPQADQRECVAVVSGFIGGWSAGTARGISSAFLLDEKNMASTQGIKDYTDRVLAIRPSAQCIAASGVTLSQFIERYVVYVTARPERDSDIFYEVMAEMVENTICGRLKRAP